MGVPDLLTLDQVAALRAGKPIPKGPGRLERKEAKDKASDKAWDACTRAVDVRDGKKCRCCKHKVEKVIELTPKRAEHHHIVRRRKVAALRTDVRNVLLLCFRCHEKVTKHQLHIIGKASEMFELDGQKYLNADKPLRFVA